MCYNLFGLYLQGEIKMKKIFLVSMLIVFSVFCINAGAYAQTEGEEEIIISEIGSLVTKGKYNAALEKVNDSIIKYPENAFLYYWKATVLSSLGYKKNAVDNFTKSIELDPENVGSYILRGICKYELNDYEGALADYNKAIELDPHNISAYNMRAGLKLNMGDLDGANEDFEHLDKVKEDN